jgi:hypothetical protein
MEKRIRLYVGGMGFRERTCIVNSSIRVRAEVFHLGDLHDKNHMEKWEIDAMDPFEDLLTSEIRFIKPSLRSVQGFRSRHGDLLF